ncbi:MAG: hypothetical protein JSV01_07720 [Desulfobacterales bacterium]|nr:MAG: hypothetical protein JSV01_07720 [Desulfobacterales bacterium]
MTNWEEPIELRKHKRFRADENALIVFRPHSIKVASIVDIGMGGLTFRYSDIGSKEPLKELSELDIILLDRDFHLEKVPCESQRDWEIYKVHAGSRAITMRQCAVRFGELTQSQMLQLEHFIKNHTVGEV